MNSHRLEWSVRESLSAQTRPYQLQNRETHSLRQPISSLHAAYRVCPRVLSPVNPWLLGARGNGLCCIANWWSLVSCGDTDISHYSPSACVIWGRNPFVENCGKIRTEKGVLHQAEEWHVVPAPRMPAKHGFEIKHTHTHTLQLQAAERRSPVLLRKWQAILRVWVGKGWSHLWEATGTRRGAERWF